jgi:hypothetical protein
MAQCPQCRHWLKGCKIRLDPPIVIKLPSIRTSFPNIPGAVLPDQRPPGLRLTFDLTEEQKLFGELLQTKLMDCAQAWKHFKAKASV